MLTGKRGDRSFARDSSASLGLTYRVGRRASYARLVENQFVEVKDFPGFTLEDALKIASYRLTQEGYRDIEPLSGQPTRAEDGRWRLSFRVSRTGGT